MGMGVEGLYISGDNNLSARKNGIFGGRGVRISAIVLPKIAPQMKWTSVQLGTCNPLPPSLQCLVKHNCYFEVQLNVGPWLLKFRLISCFVRCSGQLEGNYVIVIVEILGLLNIRL